jgi:hypothetical protein
LTGHPVLKILRWVLDRAVKPDDDRESAILSESKRRARARRHSEIVLPGIGSPGGARLHPGFESYFFLDFLAFFAFFAFFAFLAMVNPLKV